MTVPDDLAIKLFKNTGAFERWLSAHHATAPGVWMRFAKKDRGLTSITYAEAVDVALCWGWIDGQARSYDDVSWLQRFTPRRSRSPWSKINTRKAEALIASGRMQAPGLAAIDAAKADGRWAAAYDPASTAPLPAELQAALDANPRAKAFFETLRGMNRYSIIYRVNDAKKPETRAARVADFVASLERHETVRDRLVKKQASDTRTKTAAVNKASRRKR
jgi:uncharacterized protein YdeI (YjbR/CyaY-like superfamily)